jgi:hypothetical protein
MKLVKQRSYFPALFLGLIAILSFGVVSGALAGVSNPASDLTVVVQELENGDVKFSLSGTAYYKQSSGYPYQTPTDSSQMTPPHTLDVYEYFTIPDGLTLTVPNNDPMPVSPTREATLSYLDFNSSGYWSFYSFYTGNLNFGDAITGSGMVVTDEVPFSAFEVGTYFVEGDDFDMTYVVRPYAPPVPRLKAPAKARFSDTLLRKSSRNSRILIRNVGEGAVENLAVRISGGAARDFRIQKRPSSMIAPGGSTNLTVSFRPRAVGKRRAVASLMSNAPTRRVALTGKGLRVIAAPRIPPL